MRTLAGLSCAGLLLLATSTEAGSRIQKLTFDSSARGDTPQFAILEEDDSSLHLEMRLPSLEMEELLIEDEVFQALTIPEASIKGEAGQPGLPVITRLIAIPNNVGVNIEVTNQEKQVLSGYRLLPVQPDDATAFVIDRRFYDGSQSLETAVAEVGSPAIFGNLRIVPLTLSPVEYDPLTDEVTVTHRAELSVRFEGQDPRNAQAPLRSRIPESFHHLYQDVVLNYDGWSDRNEAEVGPGTYLLIYASAGGVRDRLDPLIAWRQRQGYNVLTASTSTTGSTTGAIKNYIQNIFDTVDPPLEFVSLAGDAGGSYSIPCWYYSSGEGDHYYTTLKGDDILADVHIGRLSFRDLGTLELIVDKITTYEANPPTSDSGWFTRASLTGDPGSSGITTIYVNQWLKLQLLQEGYTQIDTIWYGNCASQMVNNINQGLTVFGYRGWLGMSGMGTSHILGLTNGYELPLAVLPTCGTGDFSSDNTSRSEAFLRATNGGGIGAVGTATISTHTRYNNCYYTGIWDGAINGSEHRLGPAHTKGKLNLYLNFRYDGSAAERFSVWNNLMGDPATEMWTGFPTSLAVEHPAQLPVGANSVPVSVNSGTLPVSGALVSLYKFGEAQVTGYTDFAGQVNLPITGITSGDLLVTVTTHNRMPYQGAISVGTTGVFAGYHDSVVDDDASGGSSGNGDGVINPDETIELAVALHNFGTSAASDVTATLSSTDTYVTITDAEENFGDIGAGSTVWSMEDFDFAVAFDAPGGHVIDLDLIATSGSSHWTSLIQFTVESAAFNAHEFTWGGGGSDLDPGESGTLSVKIRNVGSVPATSVAAELSSESPWIDISDSLGSYGTVNVGAYAENTSDPFVLEVAGDCIKGHDAVFTLTLTFNGQVQATLSFTLTVGSISSTDPVGPDAYGYYAFDNTDTGYLYAPTYQWIEIDPNYGGPGDDLGLTDFGWEQDDTKIVELPFLFRFYGQDYDRISICSNGWVVVGTTYLKQYANYALPSSGSPDNIICPMWDNLYQSGNNRVYHWNDTSNHRYVIQWSRVKNDYSNATQNFEMVLYDPSYYPTASGDGEILFQYQTVNNTDSRDGYVTVGIQNHDHTVGLLYTYWNQYEPGAATLGTGRAIRILPIGALVLGTLEGTVTNASNGGTPLEGVDIRIVEPNQVLVTESDGFYSGAVQEGTYTVRAEHYSFELETETDVEILEDQTTVLDFSLTDNLGPEIENTTVYPCTEDTEGPYVIDTYITDFSTITEKHFYYRVNGGAQLELPLVLIDPNTGHHRAEIPGYSLNTKISYWLETEDAGGNTTRDPAGSDTYDFYILNATTFFADDMEDDEGWTVGAAGDDATTGIWERVDPNGVWNGGTEVQPEDDATPAPGVMCYITGNDPPGSNQGVDDVDGGKTTLLSPWFDLSSVLEALLSYRRWYTNDTGSSPGQDSWVVQVTDDGTTWVDLENTTASDRSWAQKTFLVDDYVDLTHTVRFRFIASDEGSGSLVEAGVDEFSLTGFMITIGLSGSVDGNQLTLNWTAVPGAADYWIHGVDNATFFAPGLDNRLAVVPAGTTTWSTSSGVGDPDHNWTYLVVAVDGSDQEIMQSNRVGEYDFAVAP